MVVAPTNVNGGIVSRMLDAAGPFPTTMSSWKSSIAGYRISSTARDSRWISSTNSTSPSSSFVRIAARSPARSSAGPDVMWRCDCISVATMPAKRRLAEPWRAGEQEVIDRLATLASGLEHDRQVLLQLTLADELVERPGSQAGLDRLLDVGGHPGIEELVTHGAPPEP